MKQNNNNTKPSNVQQSKAVNITYDLRDSMDATSRFINRFGIIWFVYLPNRTNSKKWICILSSDTAMEEKEIILQYVKRRT